MRKLEGQRAASLKAESTIWEEGFETPTPQLDPNAAANSQTQKQCKEKYNPQEDVWIRFPIDPPREKLKMRMDLHGTTRGWRVIKLAVV
ncbi:hypothetical protein IFM89_016794 [Coptis chinensis]|uniref:Uncharacterized protein n=1 Tax=Coptis chinensis TaxID=261450 RepID=A0A835IX18_9MAGN|nr:hypothetical protein IFM89_016794 [Coptis chinensis]